MTLKSLQAWWIRFKKPVLIIGSLLLAYALIGFLLIPALLEWQLPKLIKEYTGRDSSIRKVEMNPFALSLSLQGFELQEQNGDRFTAFDEFFVNFQGFASLFGLTYTFDEIRLNQPYTQVAILDPTLFNFSDMIPESTEEKPPEESGGIPPVRIHRLHIQEGQFRFQDRTHQTLFEASLIPINLALNDFTTVQDEESGYQLGATLGSGGVLNWQGDLTVNPLRSSGQLSLQQVKARPLWNYIRDRTRFEIQDGQMGMELTYQLDGSGDTMQLLIEQGRYQLEQLVLSEKGQDTPVMQIPQFKVAGIAVNRVEQSIDIQSVQADAAKFSAQLAKDGTFSYVPLFALETPVRQAPASAPVDNDASAQPWVVRIQDIALNQFDVDFQDQGPEQPVTLALTPLNVRIQQLDTTPGSSLSLHLDSGINQQGHLNVNGSLAMDPMATDLDLDLSRLALETFYPYAAASLQQLAGALNLKGKLHFHTEDKGAPVVNYDGGLHIDRLQTAVDATTVASERIQLQGQLAFRQDAQAQPKIDYNGSIGVQKLATTVDELDLKTDAITLQGALAFANSAEAKPIINYDGSLDVNGLNTAAKPFRVKTSVIHTDGKLVYQGADTRKPALRYTGKSHIADFHTTNMRSRQDVAKWKKLSFNGLEFDHDPMRVNIAEVVLDRLYSKVVIEADGSLNLSADNGKKKPVEPKPSEKLAATSKAGKSSHEPEIPVKIKLVRIQNSSLNFADRSLKPGFATGIHKLNGSIEGLSSNRKAKATVAIRGQVDKHAPVDISGYVNPFSTAANTDLKLGFKNISLTSFTPYSGKFAGHKIEKGKLSMDLRYQLDQRKLKADNKIILDQFTLGEQVDSPDATSLPVKLAIGLLKDPDGKIDLDLPISGSLDDPQFSIWGLVGKALMNLLTKAIASPFALIGGLAGGGGEELSFIRFAPGIAKLDDAQTAKLGQVANALKQRPQLSIEVKGMFDVQADSLALAEKAVMKILKEEEGDEDNVAVGDTIPMDNEDYVDELVDLYEDLYDDQEDILDADEALEKTDPEQWTQTIRQRVLDKQTIDESELRILAQQRTKQIQTYLIQQGQLEPGRIFLLDVDKQAEETGSDADGIKTTLSLTAS